MDLNALLILNEVIRQQSFTKAAATLDLPSSNVSRKIQMLEAQLGIKLIHRSTRSVTATDEGKRIVQLAKGLIDSNQQIQDWILDQSETPQGHLTITGPESFAQWPLSDWLIEFKQAYPDINIDLLSDSQNLSFADYALDFAFRVGQLQDSNLIAKELFKTEFGFYATSTFLKEHGPISTMDELKAVPSIASITDHDTLPWIYKQKGKLQSFIPNASFKVKDQLIALNACQKHIGVAFLPCTLVEHYDKRGTLKPLLEKHWPTPMSIYLVYRDKTSAQASRHKVFIEFIMECI